MDQYTNASKTRPTRIALDRKVHQLHINGKTGMSATTLSMPCVKPALVLCVEGDMKTWGRNMTPILLS